METFVDLYLNVDGEKISIIHQKLVQHGLRPTIGDHDFIYNWKGIVTMEEELKFIDIIQCSLKGTGAILRFTTIR